MKPLAFKNLSKSVILSEKSNKQLRLNIVNKFHGNLSNFKSASICTKRFFPITSLRDSSTLLMYWL